MHDAKENKLTEQRGQAAAVTVRTRGRHRVEVMGPSHKSNCSGYWTPSQISKVRRRFCGHFRRVFEHCLLLAHVGGSVGPWSTLLECLTLRSFHNTNGNEMTEQRN